MNEGINNQINYQNYLIHDMAYCKANDKIMQIDKKILEMLVLQKNCDSDTIVHIAAKTKNYDLLKKLLSSNINCVYQKNNSGFTPLYYVVDDIGFIGELFMKYKIHDFNIINNISIIGYYLTIKKDIDMVVYLLDRIEPNNITRNLVFDLIGLCISNKNKSKILKNLIKACSKNNLDCLNIYNTSYLSPLIIAIESGDILYANCLIDSGANIDYFGPDNNHCPLVLALVRNEIELVIKLLENNIKLDTRDKFMRTPSHYIFSIIEQNNENQQIVNKMKKLCLQNVNDINEKDIELDTVLGLITASSNWKIFYNILEEKKMDIYSPNRKGLRPIDNISKEDYPEFIHLVYRSYLDQLDSTIEWADPVDQRVAIMVDNGKDIMQSDEEFILNKIINGQSYPLKKSDSEKIIIESYPKVNITHFTAYTHSYVCYLIYLLEKYPSIKIPDLDDNQFTNQSIQDIYQMYTEDYRLGTASDSIIRTTLRDCLNHSPYLLNHIVIWSDDKYYFPPYIFLGINKLINDDNTKMIIIKLSIAIENTYNHSNTIIIDLVNKCIERFDPYGDVNYYYYYKVDTLLKSIFFEHMPSYKYLSPKDVCNGSSYQIFSDENNDINYVENDPSGFCMAWCLWYVEMRIMNIDKDIGTMIKKSIEYINKNEYIFKDYIRNYSDMLDKEKNKILDLAGIPNRYWYATNYPKDLHKKYLGYIRKYFENKQ